MLFRLMILVIQLKKADYDTKTGEIEKKNTDHDHCKKYFTTKEFNKLMVDNFAAKLVQADLSTKANIDYLVEKTQ